MTTLLATNWTTGDSFHCIWGGTRAVLDCCPAPEHINIVEKKEQGREEPFIFCPSLAQVPSAPNTCCSALVLFSNRHPSNRLYRKPPQGIRMPQGNWGALYLFNELNNLYHWIKQSLFTLNSFPRPLPLAWLDFVHWSVFKDIRQARLNLWTESSIYTFPWFLPLKAAQFESQAKRFTGALSVAAHITHICCVSTLLPCLLVEMEFCSLFYSYCCSPPSLSRQCLTKRSQALLQPEGFSIS